MRKLRHFQRQKIPHYKCRHFLSFIENSQSLPFYKAVSIKKVVYQSRNAFLRLISVTQNNEYEDAAYRVINIPCRTK